MTPPATYRIADKPPVFPCWIYGSEFGWVRGYEDEPINDDETHWCHSEDRPTHDPTAPATPASSAAKGGDIPRTPTDSEMLDWLEKQPGSVYASIDADGDVLLHFVAVPELPSKDRRGFTAKTVRVAIAAAMRKKS